MQKRKLGFKVLIMTTTTKNKIKLVVIVATSTTMTRKLWNRKTTYKHKLKLEIVQ